MKFILKRCQHLLEGIGSVLFPPIKPHKYPFKSDYDAIKDDWEKIGEDLKKVLGK